MISAHAKSMHVLLCILLGRCADQTLFSMHTCKDHAMNPRSQGSSRRHRHTIISGCVASRGSPEGERDEVRCYGVTFALHLK